MAIVIIGGTSGIGLSGAKALNNAGHQLAILGKDEESCENAQKELPNAIILCRDACKEGTSSELIDKCLIHFGSFDGLYHVAGGSGRKFGDDALHLLTLDAWKKTFELNLQSLMLSNQAAIQQFQEQKTGGAILNLSSVLGFSPSPKHFYTHAYAAAKSAIIGFSKSIASYYAPNNIRVNVIAPGLVETPMSKRALTNQGVMDYIKTKQVLDGGRIGSVKDLDEAALFFLTAQSNFITGQVLAIDGGWSISEGQN